MTYTHPNPKEIRRFLEIFNVEPELGARRSYRPQARAQFRQWLNATLPEAERIEATNHALPEWHASTAARAASEAARLREERAKLAIMKTPPSCPVAMALKMRVVERNSLDEIDTGYGIDLVAAIDDAYRAAEPAFGLPVTVKDYGTASSRSASPGTWRTGNRAEWWPDDEENSPHCPDADTMAVIRRCREGLQRRIDRTPGMGEQIAAFLNAYRDEDA